MIPGGFINLTETPGSTYVEPSSEPESPDIGAVRKIEKKLCDDKGDPLIRVHPDRLIPIDTLTLVPQSKKKRVVVGHMLRLTADEVSLFKKHISRAQPNSIYGAKASARTNHPISGKPEVAAICIFNLADAVAGKVRLLHLDQLSLFKRISARMDCVHC
jgi:hypothetical protein